MSIVIPCRRLGPRRPIYDDRVVARCVFCGWVDTQPADLQTEESGELTGCVRAHRPQPWVLVKGQESGAVRYFLEDKPVYYGNAFELQWWSGTAIQWLPCSVHLNMDLSPVLFFVLPGHEGREVSACVVYNPELVLRWPQANGPDRIPRYVDTTACRACGSRKKPCSCG